MVERVFFLDLVGACPDEALLIILGVVPNFCEKSTVCHCDLFREELTKSLLLYFEEVRCKRVPNPEQALPDLEWFRKEFKLPIAQVKGGEAGKLHGNHMLWR